MHAIRSLYIIGAGGFGAEVEWLLNDLNLSKIDDFILVKGFVNQLLDDPGHVGADDHCGLKVISGPAFHRIMEDDYYGDKKVSVAIAIGDVAGRRQALSKIYHHPKYPTIIHPSVCYDKRPKKVVYGRGTIVCAGSVLTTNIMIGEFVHINLDCTIGHDVEIGDFCTLSPGVHISGKVKIGDNVFLGTGAVVLPGLNIGKESRVGAGAVVTKDVAPNSTVVGIPARVR